MPVMVPGSQETGRAKRHYTRHPFSEKEKVVKLYEQGLGSKRIAREMKLDDSMVRSWLRKYRALGLDALLPHRRRKPKNTFQRDLRQEKDRQFMDAMTVLSTSLESVASIARRFQIDYSAVLYHVRRYHPELWEKRKQLQRTALTNLISTKPSNP